MKGLLKLVYKMSKIEQLCLGLLIILIISQFRLPTQESFSIQNKKYVLLDNRSLYDAFYASVYDDLLLEPNKNAFEISEILHFTDTKTKHIISLFLCFSLTVHGRKIPPGFCIYIYICIYITIIFP